MLSLPEDQKRLDDPDVLQRLADAARMLTFAAVLQAALVGILILPSAFSADSIPAGLRAGFNVLLFGGMFAPLLATVARLWLTPRSADAADLVEWFRHRRPASVVALAGVPIVGLTATAYYMPVLLQPIILTTWVTVPSALLLVHLRSLMFRTYSPLLARRTVGVQRGLYAFGFAYLVREVVQVWPQRSQALEDAGLALTAVNLLGGIVLGVIGVRLMLNVWRSLTRSAQQAQVVQSTLSEGIDEIALEARLAAQTRQARQAELGRRSDSPPRGH